MAAGYRLAAVDETDMTSKLDLIRQDKERTVYRRCVSACARSRWLAYGVLLATALVAMLVGAGSQAVAGCHAPGEDWYRDYHHGYQPNAISEILDSKPKAEMAQIYVYEDGEMRAIANPLPPRCQGPQCQQSPNQQNLDGVGVIELNRNITVAMSSSERALVVWPIPASDWLSSDELGVLAGFPASLEEPPRNS